MARRYNDNDDAITIRELKLESRLLRNVQWTGDTAATCAHAQRNGSEVNLLFRYGWERIGWNGMTTTTCETTTTNR